MRRLGYAHFGFDYDMHHEWLQQGQILRCLKFAEGFDSFDDLPWSDPRLVAAFADYFPDSSYVLLKRDPTAWRDSWRAHFRQLGQPVTESDEELICHYHRHNEQVLQAIAGKGRLLCMNVCAGEGYEVLCPFLGLPILKEPFPRENQRRGASL
jgi:hypothetical protein